MPRIRKFATVPWGHRTRQVVRDESSSPSLLQPRRLPFQVGRLRSAGRLLIGPKGTPHSVGEGTASTSSLTTVDSTKGFQSTSSRCFEGEKHQLGRNETTSTTISDRWRFCFGWIESALGTLQNKAGRTFDIGNIPFTQVVLGVVVVGILHRLGIGTVLYLCTVLRLVGCVRTVGSKWLHHFAADPRHQLAIQHLRAFGRRLLKETERAIKGDYSRQVAAGYVLYCCTAPGESYVGACVRYRMSLLNRSIVEELDEWQMRRLGYQKSERDLFQ